LEEFAEAVFAAEVFDLQASVGFTQKPNDLLLQ
jgi:hypothetical protein